MITDRPTFCFRKRLELHETSGRLPFKEKSEVIANTETETVELRSLQDVPLDDATEIALWGFGYEDETQALHRGMHWTNMLQRALAAVNLPADFGLRRPNMGGMTDQFRKQMSDDSGVNIVNDSWDVLVVPAEPQSRFLRFSAQGTSRTAEAIVRAAIDAAAAGDDTTPVNEVAFDLFTAAEKTAAVADSRLVIHVMALECILEPSMRTDASLQHLESLVEATRDNPALPADEREALISALRSLRRRSVRSAARTLAQTLDERDYHFSPRQVIDDAFRYRNAIVHGRSRPDIGDVGRVAAELGALVGEQIAGAEVMSKVREARR